MASVTKSEQSAGSQDICQMIERLTCPLYLNRVQEKQIVCEIEFRLGKINM